MLVVQNLAVAPMLIVLPHVGDAGASLPRLVQASLMAPAFLLAMVLVGTKLLPALLRRVAARGARELFLVAVVAAGVGIGALAFQLGLSFAIGAFTAGMVLSESALSHQALRDVGPLRDVFGLVFFCRPEWRRRVWPTFNQATHRPRQRLRQSGGAGQSCRWCQRCGSMTAVCARRHHTLARARPRSS